MKKILISERKDADGIKVIEAITHAVHWGGLREEVENALRDGQKTITIKFYERTQKWLDKLPEYQN